MRAKPSRGLAFYEGRQDLLSCDRAICQDNTPVEPGMRLSEPNWFFLRSCSFLLIDSKAISRERQHIPLVPSIRFKVRERDANQANALRRREN